jgi:tetratricopeptide (TPR) repeat protein
MSIIRWTKKIFFAGRWLSVGLAVVLAGCWPDGDKTKQETADADRPSAGPVVARGKGSVTGNFLAGRFAEKRSDLAFAAEMMLRVLEEDPENETLQRRAFMLALAAGMGDKALPLAQKVGKSSPENSTAALVVAADHLRKGENEAALAALANVSNNGLARYTVPLAKAWIQAGAGDPDAAVTTLKALGETKGFVPMQTFHAALILELAGRLDEAEKQYRAVFKDPKEASLRPLRALAALLQRQGKKDDARDLLTAKRDVLPESIVLREDLERIAADKPLSRLVTNATEGMAEALFNFASILPRERMENTILLYAQIALLLRPDFPVTQVLVGDVLAGRERYKEAIAVYRGVDRKSAFGWSTRLRIADTLYDMEKLDEAKALLEEMAKEKPERMDALLKLGNFMRFKERYKEAVEAYDDAFKRLKKPTKRQWMLYYSRGIALERSKQWERAEKDFLKALSFEPEQPYVLNYLGYSWVERGKNVKRAREMIELAVKQRQNDGYIVDSMGWVLYQLGEYKDAVGHLERAVQLRPQDPVINDHLGDAYWRVGRWHEARFQWRRALSFKPEKDERGKIEVKLEKGLGEAKPIIAEGSGG